MKKFLPLLSLLISSTQLNCMNKTTRAFELRLQESKQFRKGLEEKQRALTPSKKRPTTPLRYPAKTPDNETLTFSQIQAMKQVIAQANNLFPKIRSTITPEPKKSDEEPHFVTKSKTNPAYSRHTNTEKSPTHVDRLMSPEKSNHKVQFAFPISSNISRSLDGISKFIHPKTSVTVIF